MDDYPINRDVARAGLRRLGYEADLTDSGRGAVQAAAETDYDVILMDLHMPDMNGVEATRLIMEGAAGRRAPHIIALTASVFEEDRDACRRAGMRHFLGKPIDLAQMDAVLRRVTVESGARAPAPRRDALSWLRSLEDPAEPGFLRRLCDVFLADAPARVRRMREAYARGDAPQVVREAHTLASSSAALGARGMSEACRRVEAAARQGRLKDIGEDIEVISTELEEAERALRSALTDEAASQARGAGG